MRTLLIVCPFIFLAGFIDSVAGGGGLISIPAYLSAGLPVHLAAGTNKFSACCGVTAASVKYLREGKVYLPVALWSALGCICGAALGTRLALYLDEKVLRIIMLCAIPLTALFVLTRKNMGGDDSQPIDMSRRKRAVTSILIGLTVGIYDGLIGPGTGTFLILGYTSFLGIDLLKASGCAKVSNLASNLTSVTLYALSGQILYSVAIPAAICSMVGNYCGARYAVKGGSGKVRKIMLVVLVLLFGKIIYDLVA